VEFVETGDTNSPELIDLARQYLAPILHAGCDTLVLGCTHYPLLTGVISYVVGDSVTLVSSAEETAKDVYRELARTQGFRDEHLPAPDHRFLATGDPEPFERLRRRFLGPDVSEVVHATRTGSPRADLSA
jgi:glutamate racemase